MVAIYLTTIPLQFINKYKDEFNNKERIFIGFTGMKGITTGVLAMIAYIELYKFNELIHLAEIILYSSVLVIIFTVIIQAIFLKKLATRTDVLINFETDELDIIKGKTLILEASLNYIKDEIKKNSLQIRDLKNISIPLREELYTIREHLSRMQSEQKNDLTSLQLSLNLNQLAQHSLYNSWNNDEIQESTYQTILSNLLSEKSNIDLYIKGIETKVKGDTLNEVNLIYEDLDIIEDEIKVLDSNQNPNDIIKILENLNFNLQKRRENRSKIK